MSLALDALRAVLVVTAWSVVLAPVYTFVAWFVFFSLGPMGTAVLFAACAGLLLVGLVAHDVATVAVQYRA